MKRILLLATALVAFVLVACSGREDIVVEYNVDEKSDYLPEVSAPDTLLTVEDSEVASDAIIDLVEDDPIFTMQPLPPHIIQLIDGSSFHPEAPFGHDFLTYLTISHWDFEGNHKQGHMIVAEEIGREVLEIFEEIFHAGFPIERMRLIDFYNALDYYSMADNNSAAFNFRTIAGTNTLSRHAFGMAIDINPIQNPYIRGDTIWPAAGIEYIDRENVRTGMITRGCPVYTAFTSRGWIWGGNWTSPRDYHHFERR
ncbi:MAG: M15 family metallopeptidase [Defluviitaleaceae bacterium]|nr:M15 family metallopeptidase [Defluviitaleaceae bacterium]